jgi:CTP-dependent riboflavin kinase
MKAVSMIFEYALLFMFGIIIFISSVGVFSSYETYFNSVSVDDQLTIVREYMSSSIIKLAEMSSREDSSMVVTIPKKIGGDEGYMIELSAQGLNVTSASTHVSKHSDLFNLSRTMDLSGRVVSGAGSVKIYKTGNQIIIS